MTNTVKRKAISEKTKIDVAIRQSAYGALTCPLCFHWLDPGNPRVLEHMTPHAFTADNSIENLRWVHKACADKKTRGCEGESKKGSVANGDTHKIAKADRLANPKPSKKPMRKASEEIKAANRERRKQFRQQLKAEGRI